MIDIAYPTVGFRGKYRCQVRKAVDDKLVRDTGEFNNIITNIGLDWLGSRLLTGLPGLRSLDSYFVGTGTAVPAATDVAVTGTWVRTTSTQTITNSNSGAPDYYATWSSTKRFAAGVATGTWTEVGIGSYESTGPVNRVFSRALIVDGGGSPISITVLADEYLDVTYTLELHQQNTDFSGSFLLSGVTYNYTGRRGYAAQLAIGNSWTSVGMTLDPSPNPGYPFCVTFGPLSNPSVSALGPITDTITNSTSINTSGITFSEAAYINGSYTKTCTDTYPLSTGNYVRGIIGFLRGLAGIGGSSNYIRSGWQILLDKPIPKDATKILTLNWSASWARM